METKADSRINMQTNIQTTGQRRSLVPSFLASISRAEEQSERQAARPERTDAVERSCDSFFLSGLSSKAALRRQSPAACLCESPSFFLQLHSVTHSTSQSPTKLPMGLIACGHMEGKGREREATVLE
mmetsp:Transcript_30035/g.58966  ORF Transcript_30035/g.58966 Transcript_30035/m.58966 type:complete len:127 (+) Transcript_30035:42-422(+)